MPDKNNINPKTPTLKTLERLDNRTTERLQKTIDADQKALRDAISKLEIRIKKMVSELKTTDAGLLKGPKVNLKQAQEIHKNLTRLYNETYGKEVKTRVKDWDKINAWVTENYKDLGVAVRFSGIDKTMIEQLQNSAVFNLLQVSDESKSKIGTALYQHIAAQSPFDELVTTIAGALTGQKDAKGKPLSQYAELYANDGVMNYYNSVHIKKGQDAGLDHYMYMGTLIQTSREFCEDHVGEVYSEEEINSWTYNWSGKSGPALTHRGGWNCRHHWQPVNPAWFDEETTREKAMPFLPEEEWNQYDAGTQKKLFAMKKKLGMGSFKWNDKLPRVKWFYSNFDPNQRAAIIEAWQKDGIKIPSVLRSVPSSLKSIAKGLPKGAAKAASEAASAFAEADSAIAAAKKAATLTEAETVAAEQAAVSTTVAEGGKTWNELSNLEKQQVNKVATLIKKGKFKTTSKYVKTWETLDPATQQMKLQSWAAKGIQPPPGLPIKGAGETAKNILKAAGKYDGPVDWTFGNIDDAKAAFKKKFGFTNLEIGSYSNTEGMKVINRIGKAMDDIIQKHPEVEKLLKKFEGNMIEVINDFKVHGNATGSYGDKTKILKIAGKLKNKAMKLNTIGKAGDTWSVVDGFEPTFRHELGHHIDNALRALDPNHQNTWRNIYKGIGKEEWKNLFGQYTSTNKYEGFADAFAVFTDPKYKAGTLPSTMEQYLQKVLGGDLEKALKKAAAKGTGKAAKKAAQEILFNDPKLQQKYQDLYDLYIQHPMDARTLGITLKNKAPNVMEALDAWQGNTHKFSSSALKLKAELMEGGVDKNMLYYGKKYNRDELLDYALNNIPDEEYLHVRAATQAYYDRKGKKYVKLYRGTNGGNTGPKWRQMVNELKDQVPESEWDVVYVEVKEPVLNGWSTRRTMADSFGANGRGVTTIHKMPTRDIFLPDEVWPKRGYQREKEYICFSRTNQKYTLAEIQSNYIPGSGLSAAQKASAEGMIAESSPHMIAMEGTSQIINLKEVAKEIKKLPEVLNSVDSISEGLVQYVKKQAEDWQHTVPKSKAQKIKLVLEKKYDLMVEAAKQGKTPYLFPGHDIEEKWLDSFKEMINLFTKNTEDFIEEEGFDGFMNLLNNNPDVIAASLGF